jgi:hypothetical protein
VTTNKGASRCSSGRAQTGLSSFYRVSQGLSTNQLPSGHQERSIGTHESAKSDIARIVPSTRSQRLQRDQPKRHARTFITLGPSGGLRTDNLPRSGLVQRSALTAPQTYHISNLPATAMLRPFPKDAHQGHAVD